MHLTENYIKGLKPGAERKNVRDDETGFGIRVEAAATGGRKSFFWNQKVNGEVYFRSLGEWPATSVKDARDRARELAGKAAKWKQAGCVESDNPFVKQPKPATNDVPLFRNLVESYIKGHLYDPKAEINNPAKAEKNLRWALGKYFKDWMERAVDSFTVQDVITLRDSAGSHHYMANRLVQYARALFAWCNNDEDGRVPVWPLPVNPAAKVKLSKEKPRKRWLNGEELVRLEEALEDEKTPPDLKDFVLLSLDTGARKNNVLAMEWTEIDWDMLQWNIPASKSKSGEAYTVDLLPRAVEILERRHKERTTGKYIFPAVSSTRGFVHLDKPFQRLVKRIGGTLADLRVHDLRRSCGALQAQAGVPLQKIAHNLGHTSMSSVLIYAQMSQEALPEAREAGDKKRQELMATARKRMKKQKKIHQITVAGGAR